MNSSKLDPADIGRAARHWLGALQDRLAGAFGILPSERPATVVEMLHRSSMRAPSYWLQLVLSMGIATLGLVLGSTAVVIGAMLVSPLMGPIIELGMGLAVGSPFLVARSILRTVASIACVVLCSALISWLAPFHEVTPEIAARTTPNVLDLLIAALCAVAAAYTATQRGADTAATAAGTAIGIALVPPLCVVGYGVGSGSTTVSGGAALLFVANFSAIVLLAVLVFILFGYGRVDTTRLEAEELADPSHRPWIRDGLGWLNRVLRSRFGPLWRVLLPAVLVATVSVPLRSALAEVTWQVRVRTAVQGLLRALPKGAVRTSVNVERGNVAVRLMLVGTQRDARALEARLSEEVRGAAGVDAVVEVIPVPNEAALREAVAAARMPVVSPKVS